jgi:hypothetical protein
MGFSKFGVPKSLPKHIRFSERDLYSGAIETKSADCLILNSPTGNLASQLHIEGVTVHRYEHKLAIELLRSIKDDGKALLIMDGDGADTIGKVQRTSMGLHTYLYQNYNVTSCVDFDIQSNNQKRIYTIDGRKLIPSLAFIPDVEIPMMHTNAQLINWYNNQENFNYKDENSLNSLINALAVDDIKVNDFQSKYASLSKIGEPTSKIPKNLSVSIREGFARFLSTHSDIDDFVITSLQMDMEQLKRVFTPEQVDAIGLAIWRDQNGLAFLNGDKTGEGKGRVNAAMIRYNILQGRKAIFITSKATLFQDLWRDIMGIESQDLIKPFLVNEKSSIVDIKGNVIAEANPSAMSKMIQAHEYPDDRNLVLLTYSQLNRATKYEKINTVSVPTRDKSSWLKAVSSGKFINLDESHLASGSSNTNRRIIDALANGLNVLYSSGTWARTEKNFSVYYRLLRGIEPEIIQQAVKKGGDVLLEIFSSSLASDGGFIRRESDISNVTIEPRQNLVDFEKNKALSNSFADVAQALAILSGGLDRVINESNQTLIDKLNLNSKNKVSTKDIGMNNTSFGSLLSNLSKQFVLALNSEFAAQEAISSLERNEKPFIALEFAGNQFYKMMYEAQTEKIAAGLAPADYTLDKPLQFRDLFSIALDKLTTVRDKQTGLVRPNSQLLSPGAYSHFSDTVDEIRKAIAAVPDLPFMPVDHIRHRLEAKNYSFAEVSGRDIRIDLLPDGRYQFVKFSRLDALNIRNAFNNGDLDVILGTKAMTDGVSIHSDALFKDQRQRRLIEVEVFRNVTDRIQLLGRINRRGQVNNPIVSTLSCGLPAQERLNAMSNFALTKMSANMTSNRDSSFAIDTINLLNEEGDMVCQKYLETNPGLIHKLGMKPEDIFIENITKSSVNSLARKLTARLILLPYLQQEKVYSELAHEYTSRIVELNNKGINPLKPTHLDIKATEITRSVYKGVQRNFYPSIFDEPVNIVEIEYEEKISPWSSDRVLDKVDVNREWLRKDPRMIDDSLAGLANIIISGLDKALLESCDNDKDLLEAIIKDRGNRLFAIASGTEYKPMSYTPVVDLVNKHITRSDYLKEVLPKLQVGSIVSVPSSFYSSFNLKGDCVITELRLPQEGSEHNPSQYSFKVLTPGDTEEMVMNLDSFYKSSDQEFIQSTIFDEFSPLCAEFDSHEPCLIYRSAVMLEGNLFAAALESADEGLGKPVTYTTDSGVEKRAIMLRHDLTVKDMLYKPTFIHDAQTAADYLRCCKEGYICSQEKRSDDGAVTLLISQSKDSYNLMMPGGVKKSREMAESPHLQLAVNGRNIESTRSYNKLEVHEDELDAAMKALYKMGIKFKTKQMGVVWVNEYKSNQIAISSPLKNPKTHINIQNQKTI